MTDPSPRVVTAIEPDPRKPGVMRVHVDGRPYCAVPASALGRAEVGPGTHLTPERLDLLDIHCQMARDEGVLVAISSDAHSTQDFDNLVYGVGQARRGWLEPVDVLNTRPWFALRKMFVR